MLPAEPVERGEQRAGLRALVQVAERELPEHVAVDDRGLERAARRLEPRDELGRIEGEAGPHREPHPHVEVGPERGVGRVEILTPEERIDPCVQPPRRILLLDEEHAAPLRDGEAPTHGEAERDAQRLLDRVVALAELLLPPIQPPPSV